MIHLCNLKGKNPFKLLSVFLKVYKGNYTNLWRRKGMIKVQGIIQCKIALMSNYQKLHNFPFLLRKTGWSQTEEQSWSCVMSPGCWPQVPADLGRPGQGPMLIIRLFVKSNVNITGTTNSKQNILTVVKNGEINIRIGQNEVLKYN